MNTPTIPDYEKSQNAKHRFLRFPQQMNTSIYYFFKLTKNIYEKSNDVIFEKVDCCACEGCLRCFTTITKILNISEKRFDVFLMIFETM